MHVKVIRLTKQHGTFLDEVKSSISLLSVFFYPFHTLLEHFRKGKGLRVSEIVFFGLIDNGQDFG